MTGQAGTSSSAERRLLAQDPSAQRLSYLSTACGFAAAALVVASAWLMSQAIARVFLGGERLEAVAGLLVGIVALALARTPLLWAQDVLAQRASNRLRQRLRRDLTGRLVELGPAFTLHERTGELASVVVNGLEVVDAYVTEYRPARLLAGLVPILIIAVVVLLDPPTVLVLLFTGPILVLLLGFIGSRARSITERRFRELRWMSALFLDLLQGLATLKSFGRSAEQADTIRDVSRRYGDTTMDVLRTAFQTSLVLEWGAAVAMALVAVEVSLRLIAGSIAFERALAVLVITPEFFLPLRQLATRYHSGAAGRTVAERIFTILDEPGPAARSGAAPPTGRPASAPLQGDGIRFDRVSFTYPGRDHAALNDLDLTLGPGRLVALVGATGAGKSTIANLLLRFIEPDNGTILVGRTPLAAIDSSAWRRSLAWVPQRPHLFHGTIADNIRLSRPDATIDEVSSAAARAGVAQFIEALPRGYDSPVGERGIRLSGGQRQRLAIARAFLIDAQLVILDEVTSQLDAESETVIIEAIRRLADQRAVLVIAHRLRLAEAADVVVVLDDGRVVETGPPNELLIQGGPFRRLVDAGTLTGGATT